ncbi:MAG: hypothetical protein PHR79_06645 [Bacteroidales bacterium]|nr:hypothetical protein [Bacteroidales bacterium]
MKTIRNNLFLLFVISILISTSCKEDTVRPDTLALPEDMTMTMSIDGASHTPVLFDNYIYKTTRQSTKKGKYLVLSSLINETQKFEIAITNWDTPETVENYILPKKYLFSITDTSRLCESFGNIDSIYCDGAVIRYILSDDYVYQSQDETFGYVNITRCDPVRFKINGNFNSMLIALPPYEDTVYVQGSFENQYYRKRGY